MKTIGVCLLSGGLDSCVATTLAKMENDETYALSIDYGQSLKKEIECAKNIANRLHIHEHLIINIQNYHSICYSAITSKSIKDLSKTNLHKSDIPNTYLPSRDISFIFLACSWAESILLKEYRKIKCANIYIGTNKNDSIIYPDCKKEIYLKINDILKISTKVKHQYKKDITVKAPLIEKTKMEVIDLAIKIDSPIELTWSCYKGMELACGECDACKIRMKAFEDYGIGDFVKYQ